MVAVSGSTAEAGAADTREINMRTAPPKYIGARHRPTDVVRLRPELEILVGQVNANWLVALFTLKTPLNWMDECCEHMVHAQTCLEAFMWT